MVGINALRAFLSPTPMLAAAMSVETAQIRSTLPPLSKLINAIEADQHGLVMVLGKGGVGKTTIAAAIAVELAARGHAVHLTTTDPAAHLSMTVESNVAHLEVSRIDPHVGKRTLPPACARNKG